jgi:hypothetical protein
MRALVFLIFFFTHPLVATELLHFDQPLVEVTPDIHQRSVTSEFPFSNTTDHSVTITSVTTSCGCTVADVETRAYEPGTTGKLSCSFFVGDRSGVQNKTITLALAESPERISLTLRVNLPPGPSIQPNLLMWDKNESIISRTATISLPKGSPFQILRAVSESPSITADLVVDNAGTITSLRVTPMDTSKPLVSAIRLETNLAAVFRVFVKIGK